LNGVQDHFTLLRVPEGMPLLEALLADKSIGEVDGVLSSFDSASVFYGWFLRRPVFLYDGLFWFWQVDPYHHRVPEYVATLHRIRDRRDARGLVEMYRHLLATDHHLAVLVAYHLTTWGYARDGFGVAQRLTSYSELAGKTRVVGAVIDPTIDGVPVGER